MKQTSEAANDLISSGFRVVLGGRAASTASNLFDALSHEAPVLIQRESIAIRVRHVESLEARLKIQAGIAFARSVGSVCSRGARSMPQASSEQALRSCSRLSGPCKRQPPPHGGSQSEKLLRLGRRAISGFKRHAAAAFNASSSSPISASSRAIGHS
jgi:hypothetical protein